jgi:GNAT superfamily N-acetyltransferase
MNDAEYAAWRPRAEAEYAEDMVRAGVPEQEARAKGERDFANLLADGVESAGHDLYAVTDDGAAVGMLWLCERDADGARVLFIYDEAKRRGLPTIALNVFGGNEVARNLYRSLGYDEIAIWMTKRV